MTVELTHSDWVELITACNHYANETMTGTATPAYEALDKLRANAGLPPLYRDWLTDWDRMEADAPSVAATCPKGHAHKMWSHGWVEQKPGAVALLASCPNEQQR